ncbi:MAG: hypothetical protein V5A20_05480 [Salinibacter sp.]|uniref:hypothetical protein n=1 Tax=Salinibacter sp. TaxID=2065818 RepID=UPI002FC3170B
MKFLRRLYDAWLRHSAIGHVTEHVGNCPHCRTRTTWTVRILDGYARCQACGHSPLDKSEPVPAEPLDSSARRPDPQVPA